ncbi:MAG: helix-turn-helix transcriptional regulator [Alphaproteobacteria bacterium]|nr:helix-turn-helix transcriptional regulator [Alphaproteobacteria bacterium]
MAKAKPKKKTKGGPDGIDVHVGDRVKARRLELAMSQQELGRLIGITFQQLQKNERGTNRFSASRLFETARALEVPVSYFFDGAFIDGQRAKSAGAETLPQLLDPAMKIETQRMVDAYYGIDDRKVRQQIVGTMRALARTDVDSAIHDRPRRGRPPKKSARSANGYK